MYNQLRTELKRIFCTPFIYCMMVLGALISLSGLYEDIMSTLQLGIVQVQEGANEGNALNAWKVLLLLNPCVFIVPLLCMVVSGISFCDEMQTGNYLMILPRTSKKNYLLSKWFSGLAGGFLLMFGMGLLCVLVVSLIYPPYNPTYDVEITENVFKAYNLITHEQGDATFYTWIKFSTHTGYFVFLLDSFFWGISGMVYCAVGLIVSTWIVNRYVVLVAPFVLNFVSLLLLDIVGEKYPVVTLFKMSELLNPFRATAFSPLYMLLFVMCLLIVMGIVFYACGKRRLLHVH